MATYFDSRGEVGNLQIDDNFPAMALILKTTVTLPSNPNGGAALNYDFDSDVVPIIAIRPINADINIYVIEMIQLQPTRYRLRMCTFKKGVQNVELFIFGKPAETSSTYGMKLYNSSGGIVFDSAWKLMRVKSFFGGYPNQPQNYPEGTGKLAIAITSPSTFTDTVAYPTEPEGGSGSVSISTNRYGTVVLRSGTNLVVKSDFYMWSYYSNSNTCSGGTPDQNDACSWQLSEELTKSYGSLGSGILVVDVTGY